MSDTQSSFSSTTTAVSSTTALPLSQAIHSVNIKSLVSYTLDTQVHNYGKWSQLFTIILGRFDLLHHITTSDVFSDDPAWVRENLTVLSWIFATISEDLVDMVIRPPGRRAHAIWCHLCDIFSGNKASRAVHLEAAFHSLTQGDLSAHDYCHRLQQLANNLADCDAPIDDRTLVHQLVAGMNTKYHTLRTLLPTLPVFPSFMQARDMLLLEEHSQSVSDRRTADTALVATATRPSSAPASQLVAPTNNAGGVTDNRPRGGYDRGRGRGRGRGFRYNSGGYNGGGRSTGFLPPWVSPWPAAWRAPWTGASGPDVLGARPQAQAFLMLQQPHTTFASLQQPLQQPSWDISGLVQALQAASVQSRQAPTICLWTPEPALT